ncbi:hypothetical protein Mgra_00004903, partial [Meloidogyne graminicola]
MNITTRRRTSLFLFKLQKRILFIRSFGKIEFPYINSSLNSMGKFDSELVQKHYFSREDAKNNYLKKYKLNKGKEEEKEDLKYSEKFTMILPPPNVTGNLHVGHALTVVVEDSICRFNKFMERKERK